MCVSEQPELVSDSPVMVADSKFAETTKFLQNVLVLTKWCLLIRTCFSGKLPTAFLFGRKWGEKKKKNPLMLLYTTRCFQLRKEKKNQIFVLLTVETWSREEQGNFTCSCEQAAANSFPR